VEGPGCRSSTLSASFFFGGQFWARRLNRSLTYLMADFFSPMISCDFSASPIFLKRSQLDDGCSSPPYPRSQWVHPLRETS